MDNRKETGAAVSAAVLAAVAALVCALSLYIVWYGDALIYQFRFDTGAPLAGADELASSMYAHYFSVNGRIFPHVLVHYFCGIAGQTAFAICNAVAYVCLIILMIKYAGGNWRDWRMTLAASLVTLFFCDTSYIPPHQIGYVWVSCTAVAFLIVYDRQEDKEKTGWGICLMLLAFGVLCGNGNEGIDLGIGAAIGIDMLRRGRGYGMRRLMLLAGFGIGLAAICLTPAVLSRAADGYRPPLFVSLYNMVVSLRAFWVFAVVLTAALLRRKVTLRCFAAENWLLLTAMAVMSVFNIAITVKTNRQLFGIELYSAVLTLRLLRLFRISWVWLAAGLAVVAGQYYMKFVTLSDFNRDEMELRRQLIERGNAPLYIDLIHHNPYVHPIEELSYHDCVNLFFHVVTWSDDIHRRGSQYMRHINDPMEYTDSVALYPTALAEIEKQEPRNRVVDCGNGVYMLLRLKSDPARFTLHRSLDISGMRRPMSPVEVSFDASQHPSTEMYDVFVTTFPYPLMHVDSVSVSSGL